MTVTDLTLEPLDRSPDAASATRETSPRTAALVAGVGYVVIFLFAIFGNFVVIGGMVDTADALATAGNIADAESVFRAGLLAFAVVFVVDVPVAWALHVVFRRWHRDQSLLMAWFRLVYTVFLGVAVIFLFVALELLSDSQYLSAFDDGQVEAHVLLAIEAFNVAWLVGLACFGVHLVLVGRLILASGWAHRALGYLLTVAGTAYVVDTIARAVLSDYAGVENVLLAIVAIPSVVAEAWFAVWLLRRAGRERVARSTPRVA